jgi:hypothetical protein
MAESLKCFYFHANLVKVFLSQTVSMLVTFDENLKEDETRVDEQLVVIKSADYFDGFVILDDFVKMSETTLYQGVDVEIYVCPQSVASIVAEYLNYL